MHVLLSVISVFYTALLFQACRNCLHGVPSTEATTKKKTRMRPFANDWEYGSPAKNKVSTKQRGNSQHPLSSEITAKKELGNSR